MFNKAQLLISLLLIIAVVGGCTQERPSKNPPIHLIKDMDNQPKYKAQAESKFFDDGATMRQPVPGTVARGYLRNDNEFYLGKNPDGSFVKTAPIDITAQNLQRGHERYDIYCSPCHSRVGDGKGIMINRGYVPPPTFHSERMRELPDGHIYDVITNGLRNMPSYAHQVPPDDRWAIVIYMRALQRSHNATIDDVPLELRDKVKQQ